MGKNVYVTPKNRDKWHNGRDEHPKQTFGGQKTDAAERARQLAEKYKSQLKRQKDE